MPWTGTKAHPVPIDISGLDFDEEGVARSPVRLSDRGSAEGGYYYAKCNLCDYVAEAHLNSDARASRTRHRKWYHPGLHA